MEKRKIIRLASAIVMMLFCINVYPQNYGKMSSLVRRAAIESKMKHGNGRAVRSNPDMGSICAFVRIRGNADEALAKTGCRRLASFGDIYIADIPLGSLSALSADSRVERIEAGEPCSLCLDTTSVIVDAVTAYSGAGLSQAYDGSGVVMGVMDVGFDLLHPNFLTADMSAIRISRLWDQLSRDSIGSSLYVGADYRSPAEIQTYARTRDAYIETHGTHTLGIATGTGYNTPYRGMAPGADICLVANAVSSNMALIPKRLLYKYTSATDVLGFKYIFDYAQEVGKPCVISFSEGSTESVGNDQQLFYEVLAQLVGPGRILVASAGNSGYYNTYFHKPAGKLSDGVFLQSAYKQSSLTLLSDDDFSISFETYPASADEKVEKTIKTLDILSAEDSLYTDSFEIDGGRKCIYTVQAYRSALPSHTLAYDVVFDKRGGIGRLTPLAFRVMGEDADVQAFCNTFSFCQNANDASLSGGERKCSIACPASAPDVICVGATSYRNSYVNVNGEQKTEQWSKDGTVGEYSSVGPTRFGLVKPDVVAPGTCVRSSYGSYYVESNLSGKNAGPLCAVSEYNGRSYAWGSMSGTSQATPVVSGAIALWLQANPQLSPSDILDVFAATCNNSRVGTHGEKDNSCGYGEIDVYAGLLKVLSLDGIKGISYSHPSAMDMQYKGNGTVVLRLHDGADRNSSAKMNVYSVSGRLVRSCSLEFLSGEATVSLSGMPRGVYVLQIDSSSSAGSGSYLLRI